MMCKLTRSESLSHELLRLTSAQPRWANNVLAEKQIFEKGFNEEAFKYKLNVSHIRRSFFFFTLNTVIKYNTFTLG